jgi:hypothetical protein
MLAADGFIPAECTCRSLYDMGYNIKMQLEGTVNYSNI